MTSEDEEVDNHSTSLKAINCIGQSTYDAIEDKNNHGNAIKSAKKVPP